MDKNKLANEYASNWNVSWATKEWEHDVKSFLAGFDAAESIANAKIQELGNALMKAHNEPCKNCHTEVSSLKSLITELEQQLKEHRESLRKSVNRSADLLEQLQKAEEVIEQLNIFNDAWATQESPEVEILRNSSRIKMLKLLHKYNEQYLKSRGE